MPNSMKNNDFNQSHMTSQAIQMSIKYPHMPVNLTQTGPDSFNFHFNRYNPEAGMLIAIYQAGKSLKSLPIKTY